MLKAFCHDVLRPPLGRHACIKTPTMAFAQVGVGLLSIPYAMRQAGWVGLALLYTLGAIACYTGVLLRFTLPIAATANPSHANALVFLPLGIAAVVADDSRRCHGS